MTDPEIAFNSISDLLCSKSGVTSGKMMSSPGICLNKKVFAFLWNDKMVFRLGKDVDLTKDFDIPEFEFLNPFKNKPPMKGWYVISEKFISTWPVLAEEALSKMK